MKLICAGMTDVGSDRDHNEDDFYLSDGDEALCIVADGMGGHQSGEVASSMAIEAIVDYYRETMADCDPSDFDDSEGLTRHEFIEDRLEKAIQSANTEVHRAASENELYDGMGTTIVSGYFTDTEVFIGHIGDSRVYRLRDGEFRQQTNDHSLANEYVEMGILAADDVEYFPYSNVITRACGLSEEVEVEVEPQKLQPDDLYLFCSDGLTDMVDDETIRDILLEKSDLDEACRTLIDHANANGGEDNITVVLAKILEE